MIARLQANRVRRTYRGGGRIEAFTGIAVPNTDGASRPEDWLASTTTAFNGTREIAGEGLGRLEDGSLVADAVGRLPFLVKLLDADERLVVQAHPTVPFARQYLHSSVGKTECWYFLPGTTPVACVYLGFRPGVTPARWRTCFETQTGLLDCLHRVPVRAGDFVFVDGGVPHAIGAGCFMVELQEPSDLMVVAERETPSGRPIPEAKIHGGLGFARMFDVYDYKTLPFDELCRRYVTFGRVRTLTSGVQQILGQTLTDKFEMWRLAGDGRVPLGGVPALAVVTDGAGTLNGQSVRRGDRLILSGEAAAESRGGCSIILCLSRKGANGWACP